MEPFPQKASFDTQREDIITLTSKKLPVDMTKLLQVIVVRQEQQTKSSPVDFPSHLSEVSAPDFSSHLARSRRIDETIVTLV